MPWRSKFFQPQPFEEKLQKAFLLCLTHKNRVLDSSATFDSIKLKLSVAVN